MRHHFDLVRLRRASSRQSFALAGGTCLSVLSVAVVAVQGALQHRVRAPNVQHTGGGSLIIQTGSAGAASKLDRDRLPIFVQRLHVGAATHTTQSGHIKSTRAKNAQCQTKSRMHVKNYEGTNLTLYLLGAWPALPFVVNIICSRAALKVSSSCPSRHSSSASAISVSLATLRWRV